MIQETPPEGHAATYDESVAYFTFVFNVPPGPPGVLARRLLAAGIAETCASPADGQVRMAPRYLDLVKSLQQADEVGRFDTVLHSEGLVTAARAHPRLAARVAAATVTGLVTRRGHHDRDGEGEDDGSRPAGEAAACVEDDDVPVAEQMRVLADEVNDAVAGRQVVAAVQHARDQDMYMPGYLADEPFLRLTMRDVRLAVTRPDGTADPGQQGEVLLLLHRSGVIHVAFAVVLPRGLATDELIGLSSGNGVRLDWAEVAEPVVRHAARTARAAEKDWPGTWHGNVQEGVRWRRYEHPATGSLTDLFRLYQDAVIDAGGVVPAPD